MVKIKAAFSPSGAEWNQPSPPQPCLRRAAAPLFHCVPTGQSHGNADTVVTKTLPPPRFTTDSFPQVGTGNLQQKDEEERYLYFMGRKATTVHISARFQCLNGVLTRRDVFRSFIVIASCKIQSNLAGSYKHAQPHTHRVSAPHFSSTRRSNGFTGERKKFANIA